MIIFPLGATLQVDLANACVCGDCPPSPPAWQLCNVAFLHEGQYLLERAHGFNWRSALGEDSGFRYITVPANVLSITLEQGSTRYLPAG